MPAFSNSAEAVRKWISRSEASESELPPKEHRLPEGWDEEDIIVNEDVAPIQSAPSPKKKQAAPPAPVTAASPSPSKKSTAATKKDAAPEHTQVSSPGIFPEGFFASPKTQKPTGDFPVTAAAAASPNKKKTDDAAPAPVKADAAAAAASPSLISRLTGYLMRKQDGSASPKLTGKRREREESSSSSSSDDEDEETSGGDLGSQLISMTPKQLEKSSAITIGDLKEFARENDISFNSKSKKADLVASCRTFAKKNAGTATAAGASSPSKPRAASSNSNTNTAASPAATATSASPQKAAKKKVRKINEELLTAMPHFAPISKNDEPRENWACIQMKQWAKDNKVDVSNLSLKTDILTKCWEAYDAKH